MRLPPESASYRSFVAYGRYVTRRLRRAKLTDLASDAEQSTLALRDAGRAVEDAEDLVQDALADRDAADDLLDATAQNNRAALAGRSAQAEREEPYTLIYPRGIGYYIAAPIAENARRYGELVERLKEHLPKADPARNATITTLNAGIKDFDAASRAVEAAETAETRARTKLTSLKRSFARQMEKTYGAVVAEVGKRAAEQFFPKSRVTRAPARGDREPTPPAG